MKQKLEPSDAAVRAAVGLGEALRLGRLARNETREQFAQRLRISISTLARMEAGDAAVGLAAWLEALAVLGALPAVLDAAAPARDALGEHRRRSVRRRARTRAARPDDHLDF